MSLPEKSPLDPLLLSSQWGSSLFVGVSGTGKTTLMLAAIKRHLKHKNVSGKKIFGINTRGSEYDELGLHNVGIERVASLPKKSFLVVEDIIDLGKKNEVLLRTTLNVNLHHKLQRLYAATHSNIKTNLWSNVQYFDYIIFPGEKSNHVNFKSIIIHFRLDKNSTENFSTAFLDQCGKNPKRYIVLDVKSIAVYAADSLTSMVDQEKNCYKKIADFENGVGQGVTQETNSSSAPQPDLGMQFEKLIQGYKYRARASAVYSLLKDCILQHFEVTPDLLIKVGKQAAGLSISIVDYVHFLVDPDSGVPPWKYLTFHRYVTENCHVPKLLIQNPSFLAAASE